MTEGKRGSTPNTKGDGTCTYELIVSSIDLTVRESDIFWGRRGNENRILEYMSNNGW